MLNILDKASGPRISKDGRRLGAWEFRLTACFKVLLGWFRGCEEFFLDTLLKAEHVRKPKPQGP